MSVSALVAQVRAGLEAVANADDAMAMQAYMKSSMPFLGVKRPLRKPVESAALKAFRPTDRDDYEAKVRALWGEPERELKYVALELAERWRPFVVVDSIPLYLFLIRDGAWWDFVDAIAARMIGKCLLNAPAVVFPMADAWIDDDDFWVRRTAILCQLKSKQKTDADRLFRYCTERAHETEFFIRKAIGWALREYSKTDPDAVRSYLAQMGDRLSGLSRREGGRLLPEA